MTEDHLQTALRLISESHVPDQPSSSSLNEVDYVKQHVGYFRRLALDALNEKNHVDLNQILQDPENQPSQFGTVPVSQLEKAERRIAALETALEKTRMTLLIVGVKNDHRTVQRINKALEETK